MQLSLMLVLPLLLLLVPISIGATTYQLAFQSLLKAVCTWIAVFCFPLPN